MKRITALLAFAALLGCTQNQPLAALEASVAATDALIASLQAAGKITPAIAAQIEASIAWLPDSYALTTAEMASGDDAATQAVKIASYYASTIAALNLLPPEAQIWTAAISASIKAFLASISTGAKQLSLAKGVNAPAPKISGKDAKRLQQVAVQASILQLKLLALKVKK